jgi:hypothetical protein
MSHRHVAGQPTLESVTFVVDGEFATPARKASWGPMKSIER